MVVVNARTGEFIFEVREGTTLERFTNQIRSLPIDYYVVGCNGVYVEVWELIRRMNNRKRA
ncbi:MAG: hypothetical protein NC548_22940 [Lachnospiraceae bacterium]|nr:hypothetical protein [Lachnospiraceae bacterium]